MFRRRAGEKRNKRRRKNEKPFSCPAISPPRSRDLRSPITTPTDFESVGRIKARKKAIGEKRTQRTPALFFSLSHWLLFFFRPTLETAVRALASVDRMQAAKARTAIDRRMTTREKDTILIEDCFVEFKGIGRGSLSCYRKRASLLVEGWVGRGGGGSGNVL